MGWRGLIALIALGAILVLAQSVYAGTRLVTPAGTRPQPFQGWVNRSKVPTPPTQLTLYRDLTRCSTPSYVTPVFAVAGCTDPASGWIAISRATCTPAKGDSWAWVRLNCRGTLLHEIGHNWPWTDAQKTTLMQIFHTSDWWSGGQESASERAAETYKMCALGKRRVAVDVGDAINYYESEPPLDKTRFWRICRMIH